MSDLENELMLHHQIYNALGHAVAAMQRWSGAVANWQARAARDTNGWLAANAAALRAQGVGGVAFQPVPGPAPASGVPEGRALGGAAEQHDGDDGAQGGAAGGSGGGGVKSSAALDGDRAEWVPLQHLLSSKWAQRSGRLPGHMLDEGGVSPGGVSIHASRWAEGGPDGGSRPISGVSSPAAAAVAAARGSLLLDGGASRAGSRVELVHTVQEEAAMPGPAEAAAPAPAEGAAGDGAEDAAVEAAAVPGAVRDRASTEGAEEAAAAAPEAAAEEAAAEAVSAPWAVRDRASMQSAEEAAAEGGSGYRWLPLASGIGGGAASGGDSGGGGDGDDVMDPPTQGGSAALGGDDST